MLYQLSYVGLVSAVNPFDDAVVKHVDGSSRGARVFFMPIGSQALCDALVAMCDSEVPASRLAAALVLLAAVDDDLALDLDEAPAALRAIFDDAAAS